MALVSSPFLAVIMYSPLLMRPRAFSRSASRALSFFDFALLSQGLAQVGAGLFAVLVDSFCGEGLDTDGVEDFWKVPDPGIWWIGYQWVRRRRRRTRTGRWSAYHARRPGWCPGWPGFPWLQIPEEGGMPITRPLARLTNSVTSWGSAERISIISTATSVFGDAVGNGLGNAIAKPVI